MKFTFLFTCKDEVDYTYRRTITCYSHKCDGCKIKYQCYTGGEVNDTEPDMGDIPESISIMAFGTTEYAYLFDTEGK